MQNERYVVRSGEVAVLLGSDEVERLGEGAMFGEMALIDEGPRSATVVAASRVYVRLHHASDVIGGALLGIAFGRVARRLAP